ncbi:MAG: PQQ-binding-like beta-propeller repeat protein [Planctomycetaceae bacterium]
MSWAAATLRLLIERAPRMALAAVFLAAVGFWAVNLQFGVREIHRAEASVNFALALPQSSPADWPQLYGPGGNSHGGWDGSSFAVTGEGRWTAELPGEGIGGPSVWRDQVFVPVIDASQATASLWALDRRHGRVLWKRCLHRQLAIPKDSPPSTAGVAACDGNSVFLGVVVDGRLLVSAVGLTGELRWTRDVGPMVAEDGHLVSPRLFGTLLLVAADHPASPWSFSGPTSHVTAVHRQQGEIIWRVRRRNCDSSMAPTLVDVAGQPQLVMAGRGEVRGYDPRTGSERWACLLRGVESVPVVAAQDRQLFVAAAEPRPTISAIRADQQGLMNETNTLWKQLTKDPAELPLVCDRENLYLLNQDGLLVCCDLATGKTRWQRQLRGSFRTPPVLGGEHMLCVNSQGSAFILDLRDRGDIIAEEFAHDEVAAPPAATCEQCFLRTRRGLVCIPWERVSAPLVNSPKDQPKRL